MHPSRNQRPAPSLAQGQKKVGIARALSKLGLCSRSQAADLIRLGKVRLNGAVVRNPEAPVRLGTDKVQVDNKPVVDAEKIYLMMNKPRGIVTTASDEKGRASVYSLLPSHQGWVAPVGRLDKASEGLLLFTNDSQWGAAITDPDSHLEKTYHVQIAVVAEAALLEKLHRGVRISGQTLRVKRASIVRTGQKNSWIEVVLDEGKNRQIRRMLDALGVGVLRLIRVAIGPLQLGDLPKGLCRTLRPEEKSALSGIES